MITPDLLRPLDLFSSLTDDALEDVAHVSADVRLNEGEYLLQEGDAASFYVLLEGEIDVTKEVNGVVHPLDTYFPGDSFGELPILLGSPAAATLHARTAIRALRLEPLDFTALLAQSEGLSAAVMRNLTRRVGNLKRATLQGAPAITTLVGEAADLDCLGLREFLARNQLPFRWLDPADGCDLSDLPAEAQQAPQPTVVLPDGEVLSRPHVRDLAERLGLQVAPTLGEYDLVVIGGGPAGLAAAVYAASEGLCTLLVEKNAPGGQAGTSSRIENYLGFPNGLSGDELSARALRQARRFGAEVLATREVTALHPGHGAPHEVELDGGERVQARSVIIATGVEWRTLPLAGAERLTGRGVMYGAARTEAPRTRGRDVYLIGGGNSAGQAAMHFSSYAERVTLLIRADRIEKGMSQYLIDQLHGKANVTVCLNCEVTALHGEAALEGLTVRDTRSGEERHVDTDALFVFIGADARTDWLDGTVKRDERGYVCTGLDFGREDWPLRRDPFLLETSLPGVFAVGDVRRGSIKRVAAGVGEGSMSVALVHEYLAGRD
ncbi:FAD-dependent oxidoreductase [Deinococcus aquiradiocola]|uniref:Cyclic nucleotide-binding domain-containing protein n=1 Tax=Deinococcus aquiradiocola TaxID=393059 RepID=A0A917UM98_9DEIO|nr:cyclic nucleotide-binding domain-containing thioredoxin-disulfide reductase [Deinococcus aquiradiocola]GGJ67764.1 hypothetical protein GCM10008939_10110 [Deinococcus aquiradiocola]